MFVEINAYKNEEPIKRPHALAVDYIVSVSVNEDRHVAVTMADDAVYTTDIHYGKFMEAVDKSTKRYKSRGVFIG